MSCRAIPDRDAISFIVALDVRISDRYTFVCEFDNPRLENVFRSSFEKFKTSPLKIFYCYITQLSLLNLKK